MQHAKKKHPMIILKKPTEENEVFSNLIESRTFDG
jgi:hypothetical protein